MSDQFFPPVPPTALAMEMTLLVGLSETSVVDVRLNAVPTETLTAYGDSVWAPARIQISLSTGAVQPTAIGSGGI